MGLCPITKMTAETATCWRGRRPHVTRKLLGKSEEDLTDLVSFRGLLPPFALAGNFFLGSLASSGRHQNFEMKVSIMLSLACRVTL